MTQASRCLREAYILHFIKSETAYSIMINLTISEAMTAADGQLVHCEDPAYIGDMLIEGITLDSRKVKPDWLYRR